jgi:hypothetical protein
MAHHVGHYDDNDVLAKLLREKLGSPENIGPTGEFPDGKVTEEDEGGIKFGVAADKYRGLVHIDFGKPIQWLAMTAKEAANLGQMLNEKAREVD